MLARTGPRDRLPTWIRLVGVDERPAATAAGGSPAGRSAGCLRGAGGRGNGPDRSGSSL